MTDNKLPAKPSAQPTKAKKLMFAFLKNPLVQKGFKKEVTVRDNRVHPAYHNCVYPLRRNLLLTADRKLRTSPPQR